MPLLQPVLTPPAIASPLPLLQPDLTPPATASPLPLLQPVLTPAAPPPAPRRPAWEQPPDTARPLAPPPPPRMPPAPMLPPLPQDQLPPPLHQCSCCWSPPGRPLHHCSCCSPPPQDAPCTNAGRGSNLTLTGRVQCDAGVMAGDGRFGAVAAVAGEQGQGWGGRVGTSRDQWQRGSQWRRGPPWQHDSPWPVCGGGPGGSCVCGHVGVYGCSAGWGFLGAGGLTDSGRSVLVLPPTPHPPPPWPAGVRNPVMAALHLAMDSVKPLSCGRVRPMCEGTLNPKFLGTLGARGHSRP